MVIVLVILGLGPLGAVIGAVSAMLISGIVAAIFMWILYRALPNPNKDPFKIMQTIKSMFNYGFPLSIADIISTFGSQVYVFIIPIFVAPDLIGNYGIAGVFTVLISFFAMPIDTLLFPAFSKFDPHQDNEEIRNVFRFSVKYSSLLIVPAASYCHDLVSSRNIYSVPQIYRSPPILSAAIFTIPSLHSSRKPKRWQPLKWARESDST